MAGMKHFLCLTLVLCGAFAIHNGVAAIIYPQEPAGGRQMVMQFASGFVAANLPPFRGINTTNELTFAPPLPMYASGNLTKGQLLPGAAQDQDHRQTWEYIFMRGTNVVGEAYLETDKKTGKPIKCSSVGSSRLCEEAEMALRDAGTWPQVQKQDYEARLLQDVLVSFFAIWLHGQTKDLIIPLPDTYGRMNAYQAYSESQIVTILEPEAQRDSAMWTKLIAQEKQNHQVYAQAMTDYEKAHGGNGGAISFYGFGAPFQEISPDSEIMTVEGKSSQGERLHYRAKVAYGQNRDIVKQVEILEKLPDKETNKP
jgi:hypothetical protein